MLIFFFTFFHTIAVVNKGCKAFPTNNFTSTIIAYFCAFSNTLILYVRSMSFWGSRTASWGQRTPRNRKEMFCGMYKYVSEQRSTWRLNQRRQIGVKMSLKAGTGIVMGISHYLGRHRELLRLMKVANIQSSVYHFRWWCAPGRPVCVEKN